LRVVRAGLAISLVPRELVERQGAGDGLAVIPLAEAWAERRFVVCFREADQLSLAARALMEHLVARGNPGFR
jgi:DNA-binding transcriptional LysR family regulator